MEPSTSKSTVTSHPGDPLKCGETGKQTSVPNASQKRKHMRAQKAANAKFSDAPTLANYAKIKLSKAQRKAGITVEELAKSFAQVEIKPATSFDKNQGRPGVKARAARKAKIDAPKEPWQPPKCCSRDPCPFKPARRCTHCGHKLKIRNPQGSLWGDSTCPKCKIASYWHPPTQARMSDSVALKKIKASVEAIKPASTPSIPEAVAKNKPQAPKPPCTVAPPPPTVRKVHQRLVTMGECMSKARRVAIEYADGYTDCTGAYGPDVPRDQLEFSNVPLVIRVDEFGLPVLPTRSQSVTNVNDLSSRFTFPGLAKQCNRLFRHDDHLECYELNEIAKADFASEAEEVQFEPGELMPAEPEVEAELGGRPEGVGGLENPEDETGHADSSDSEDDDEYEDVEPVDRPWYDLAKRRKQRKKIRVHKELAAELCFKSTGKPIDKVTQANLYTLARDWIKKNRPEWIKSRRAVDEMYAAVAVAMTECEASLAATEFLRSSKQQEGRDRMNRRAVGDLGTARKWGFWKVTRKLNSNVTE